VLKKLKPRVKRAPQKVPTQYRVPDFSRPLNVACPDWEKRILARSSLMPTGLLESLDQERAAKACTVFNRLRFPDVAAKPLLKDAVGEWFKEIVRAVFGSWNGVERAINEFFILVPKKNSKTSNGAGLMVTAMIRSERPRAEYLLVAPTQQVASIAFSQAAGMIEADPELLAMCNVQDYIKQITFRPNGCTLKIKSFDPAILTGVKPAGVLLDELHVIAEHSNADRILGQIRGGLISQPEAFLMTITTQSERVPSGIFRTELLKARKVRDGIVKLKLLPILYEFPERFSKNQGWRDPKNWDMVTPNKDRSITIARLQEDFASAKEGGEEELCRWASQHLNIEVGLALRSDHWVAAKLWPQSAIALTLQELLERSEVVTIGVDGGGLDDMLAVTVCGRERETSVWLTWSKAWIHKIAMDRRKQDIPVYKDFARDGDLVIIGQMGEDVKQVGDIVEEVLLTGRLNKIGIDPSAIGGLMDEFAARGIDTDKQVVGISQGWRLTSAIKTSERKLAEGHLKHANQPLTRWCVENARVEPRGNAILITKQASGSAKIDPLMAMFNAVELMSQNPAREAKYEMLFIGGAQ
jgi:phage terminase large subunit-like protein